MKKAVKIILIVLIICISLCFAPSFFEDDSWLYEEEMIDTVKSNTELLNKVPNEIKNIEETRFYVYASKISNTINLSITKTAIKNYVLCALVNADEGKRYYFKILKSEALYNVLELHGIRSVEKHYSQSGRSSIIFDCGSSSVMYYFGFYYTEDNVPTGYKGEDMEFIHYKNRWIWSESEDPENTYSTLFADDLMHIYITERICDNWFYFVMRT